jgi:hypothetical protein
VLRDLRVLRESRVTLGLPVQLDLRESLVLRAPKVFKDSTDFKALQVPKVMLVLVSISKALSQLLEICHLLAPLVSVTSSKPTATSISTPLRALG